MIVGMLGSCIPGNALAGASLSRVVTGDAVVASFFRLDSPLQVFSADSGFCTPDINVDLTPFLGPLIKRNFSLVACLHHFNRSLASSTTVRSGAV